MTEIRILQDGGEVRLNPRYILAARCNASHLSDKKFPFLSFSQKNIRLYHEMLDLALGQYYF